KVNYNIFGPLSGNNSVRTDQAAETLTVDTIQLDAFTASHRPPDLLLVDIEGSEIDALEGGLEMIAQHRPVIMVEVHWLGQAFIDFVQRALLPLGYTATTYQGGPLIAEKKRYHAILVP